MLIAGDIGGTKSHLVAYQAESNKLTVVARKRYATRDFSSFEKLIEEFSRHASASSDKNNIQGQSGFAARARGTDERSGRHRARFAKPRTA
jgi:glucokinase